MLENTEQIDSGNNQSSSRKRKRNPNSWKALVSKRARVEGKSYWRRNGTMAEERRPMVNEPLCKGSCKKKCSAHLNGEKRIQFYERFHQLDVNSKNNYLFCCINPQQPSVLCVNAKKHRRMSFNYTVTVSGRAVRVCKVAFRNLHQITCSKVDLITFSNSHLLEKVLQA